MQVGPKKTKRTFKTAKPYKKKQRTDSNALQVCTVKGSCPVPDVYNCQFTYGGYDSISMSSIGNYTGQYIYAANSSMTSPKWRRKSALLLRSTRCPVFWRFRPLQGMESQCLQDRA